MSPRKEILVGLFWEGGPWWSLLGRRSSVLVRILRVSLDSQTKVSA